MAAGDVKVYDDNAFGFPGSKRFAVRKGVAAGINSGELVKKGGIGNTAGLYVTRFTAGVATQPCLNTDFVVGLSVSASTETVTADGVVDVMPLVSGLTFLVAPNVAATWDTQAEYNALVGARIRMNVSSTGVQTALASDNVNGLMVVEPLNITQYPGQVRFSLRQAANYLA